MIASGQLAIHDWVAHVNAGVDAPLAALRRRQKRARRRAIPLRDEPRSDRPTILFLSHYFPPEGNAPASRVHEMCKRWAADGCEVTVITCAPNHPAGRVYAGYHNWLLRRETLDGIHVLRVWTFLAANKGKIRRALNFISYMITATALGLLIRKRDVLIATSPQFFCGWAGVLVSRLRRIPFVLEIRDIWPESIAAVGASNRNWIMHRLEQMEQRMYAAAGRIITVGDGYKQQLIRRNVCADKIDVIPNGVNRETGATDVLADEVRMRYGLRDRFVCAYVGTIGMAAALDVVLRAARLLKQRGQSNIVLLLVGDGADRAALQRRAAKDGLDNVIFTGLVAHEYVPAVLSAVDACLVHLRREELFESVLPSKMFEAAGMGKPMLLGVKGSAAEFIRAAGAGICFEPEDEHGLVAAIETLQADRALGRRLGASGQRYVREHFSRDALAAEYLQIIRAAARTSAVRA